ncbi:hypothetical protein, partial [Burkholderia sp. Cy-647]
PARAGCSHQPRPPMARPSTTIPNQFIQRLFFESSELAPGVNETPVVAGHAAAVSGDPDYKSEYESAAVRDIALPSERV